MKLHPDKSAGLVVTGYGAGWISINGERKERPVILDSRGTCHDWSIDSFDQLQASTFDPAIAIAPELILFGSGTVQRFPHPQWLRGIVAAGIGLETMDTAAACRTYNVLAGEGRHVVAALLI